MNELIDTINSEACRITSQVKICANINHTAAVSENS